MKSLSNTLSTQVSTVSTPSLANISKSLWTTITSTAVTAASYTVAFLTGEGYSEIRIKSKRDRSGDSYFQVFDPFTGKTFRMDSEEAVREWLEGRYSR